MLLMLISVPAWADSFDDVRATWVAIQVGASNNMSDPDIAAAVNATASTAQGYLTSMDQSAGRTYLWSDLADFTVSPTVGANFGRLQTMAAAYAQPGNSLQGNATLGQAVVAALDWLYANHYNENTTVFGNSWDWDIGDAQGSMTTSLLVYGLLNATQIANYTATIDHFDPNPAYWEQYPATGANLTDVCLAVILRGILGKNSSKITAAETALASVFDYVTTGDGFYTDGSFVQHTHIAYTASYGAVLLGDIAKLFLLLNNSAWPITASNAGNVWNWASQSFAPLIYKGAVMDMVAGRGIANCSAYDHRGGRGIIMSLLRLSYGASQAQSAYIQGLVKAWVAADTTFDGYANCAVSFDSYYSGLSPYDISNLKTLMGNSAIPAAAPISKNYTFTNMQRVVHLRPGFGFGLSLFSNKISSFECGNGANRQGWYTGVGMTYLYNDDLLQFDDNYWATINHTRLPGTTTDGSTKTATCSWETYLNSYNWVGGSVVDGLYGSTGMQFTLSPLTNSTLKGQKSWFWFDDKMVALGAGINSTSSGAVETIVDNRKLNASGNNALVVNGTAQSTTLGWSSTLTNVSWAYLDGNVANSGVGYYFPTATSLYALRESRTDNWASYYTGAPTTSYTNDFLSLAFQHGAAPTSGTYAYAVLPNQTQTSMAAYAASPDIVVLANTTSVQAVADTSAQAVGANFWTDTSTTVNDPFGAAYLTSTKKASVTTHQAGSQFDVAVADPTQANTGTIVLTINRSAASVISADPGVTVTQLAPTIQLSVNVNGAAGKNFSVSFNLNTANAVTLGDVADAFVRNGTYASNNYGTLSYLYIKNDVTNNFDNGYMKFDLSSISGSIAKATLYLMPYAVGQSGIVNQAFLASGNAWTESGINWSNAPAFSGTQLGSWTAVAGTQIKLDVTAQALSAQSSGNLLSIGLTSPTNVGSNGWVQYGAKENATVGYRPIIVVTTGTSLAPIADAFVQDGSSATTNYGTSTSLVTKVDAIGYNRTSYLKFDVSSIGYTIGQATVYLTPTVLGQTSGITNQAAFVPSSSWTEAGITWNNAPAVGSVIASWSLPAAVGTPIAFDATAEAAAVQGNGNVLTIAISSPAYIGSGGGVNYASKENATIAYRPTILVTP